MAALSEAGESALVVEMMERVVIDEMTARFYLEANAWDLELAVTSYASHSESHERNERQQPTVVVSDDSDPEFVPDERPPPVQFKKKDKKGKGKENKRFGTVQGLGGKSSSDEDEEGQAFYAGGSVRSGQQIIGPPKNKHDIVSDMFRSVREHGGLVVDRDSEAAGSSSTFSGTGYKLGATLDDTTVVPDPVKTKARQQEPELAVVLQLWRNGFSLDRGPLRPYEDPQNAEFLQYIRRGEIPPELRSGPEILLNMEDKRNENYVKPSGPPKPFQGKGALLGSPAPAAVGSTAAQAVGAPEQANNQKTAQDALNVDETEPATTIQFRLADGSRISGRFNHTHTVAQVREFITTAVPIYQLQTFILLTTFPNKELADDNQTVKDAGLLNALVVQRLK